MRILRLRPVLSAVRVALPPKTLILPEECACCSELSTHRNALRRLDGLTLLVGYCDECSEHQASASSRVLASGLASLLLGLVAALGLPLLVPRLSAWGLVFAATVASLLPLGFLLLPESALSGAHSASGPALYFSHDLQLICTAEGYGRRVAEMNGVVAEPTSLGQTFGSPWLWAGPVLAIGAAILSYLGYHPLLRVLNLGRTPIVVAIDGVTVARVDATSNESPAAGVLLRVPVGQHLLSARSSVDGSPVGDAEVDFQSGAVHLFVPGAERTCFWLETSGYGEKKLALPSYRPLFSEQHFWVLPGGIDSWFEPNPTSSDARSHSSGGVLTALRQAACENAPPEVRPIE
jgi:hypothetical protein